jgi:hypothetical protein
MSTYSARSGIGYVGAYQVSGKPYLTGSLTIPGNASTPMEITFPNVTMEVVIKNTAVSGSPDLRFGISSHGVKGTVNNNYFQLEPGESFSMRWKIAKLYLLSHTTSETSASVGAALTGIHRGELLRWSMSGAISPVNLGANWSGSVGVG